MIKPFSENISTGAPYPTEVDTYVDVSISMKHLQRGNDLDEKVKIYFNRAGIVSGPRKDWLEYKIKSEWKDEKYLQDQSPKSKDYNEKLLDFLTTQDYEYQFSQAMKGKEPLPKEVQKLLKSQIDELIKKPVKERKRTITSYFPDVIIKSLKTREENLRKEGKSETEIQKELLEFRKFLIKENVKPAQIALSRREQEKIYASPGVVPTWWWHDPEKGTYTYHAIKAIKKAKVSARDVELTIKKAVDGKKLSPQDAQIISAGWGILSKEGQKILDGKFPISEKVFRKYGEFYHRDVGWY